MGGVTEQSRRYSLDFSIAPRVSRETLLKQTQKRGSDNRGGVRTTQGEEERKREEEREEEREETERLKERERSRDREREKRKRERKIDKKAKDQERQAVLT